MKRDNLLCIAAVLAVCGAYANVGGDMSPNLSMASTSISRSIIQISEKVVVHWRIENTGGSACPKTKTVFAVYGDTIAEESMKSAEQVDCVPLASGGGKEYTKTVTGKSLGLGLHNIVIFADGNDRVAESDEGDNVASVLVKVVKDSSSKSSSKVDWEFYKPNGLPDSFYLSTSFHSSKAVTTFKKGQSIYLQLNWRNALGGEVKGFMDVQAFINKRAYAGQDDYDDYEHEDEESEEDLEYDEHEINHWDSDYFQKNRYRTADDPDPNGCTSDFLQNLPPGKYTLTVVLDAESNWVEKNEKNNVRMITFSVVDKPKIYGESAYSCVLGESVSWAMTTEGSVTMTGLPPGLKYSGGAIAGKANKRGTYTAKAVSKNAAGTVSKTITITVKNPGFVVSITPRTNGSGKNAVESVFAGETIPVYAGVKQNFDVSASPGKSGVSKSDVTSVTATGLPSGLKYANSKLTGVPTKTGAYSIKLSFKNALGWTKSFSMKMQVKALPSWAVGTFKGKGTFNGKSANVALTVGKTGKISGKFIVAGKQYSFTAASFEEYGDDGILRTSKGTMKVGKKTYKVEVAIGEAGAESAGATIGVAEIAVLNGKTEIAVGEVSR